MGLVVAGYCSLNLVLVLAVDGDSASLVWLGLVFD